MITIEKELVIHPNPGPRDSESGPESSGFTVLHAGMWASAVLSWCRHGLAHLSRCHRVRTETCNKTKENTGSTLTLTHWACSFKHAQDGTWAEHETKVFFSVLQVWWSSWQMSLPRASPPAAPSPQVSSAHTRSPCFSSKYANVRTATSASR